VDAGRGADGGFAVVADAASAIPAPPAITSVMLSAAVAAPFTALVLFAHVPTFAPSGVIATYSPLISSAPQPICYQP
jgi:hypothetical protein